MADTNMADTNMADTNMADTATGADRILRPASVRPDSPARVRPTGFSGPRPSDRVRDEPQGSGSLTTAGSL